MTKVVGTLTRESDGMDAFGRAARVLAADESRSSGTYSLIQDANGDWSIPVVAGKTYRIRMLGLWQTTNTTAGGAWKIVLAGGAAGTFAGLWLADSAASGAPDQLPISADDAAASYAGASAANTDMIITMDVVFACTTGGTFNIHMAANVTTIGTAKLMAGSALLWEPY